MHRVHRFSFFVTFTALFFVLCLSVGCKKPAADGDGDKPTTTAPAEQMRFVEVTPEKITQGKALFGACMGCHGEGAAGRVGIGPRLNSESFLAAASDQYLLDIIKNGRPGTTMAPWGASYKDDQIHSLIAYLRSLNKVDAATLDNAPLAGNVDDGQRVWRNICAGCHGRSGAGYQETANGTGIGRKGFLDHASDGFMRHIISHGKTLTKMRGFKKGNPANVADLTPAEIDGTIAYLRKNAW
jgi:mono/diheme cytochrome c family protein